MSRSTPLRGGDVAAARRLMLESVQPLEAENTPLDQADGRWLSETLRAERDQPPFNASAMDGWAVRDADVRAGAVLTIVGESAAGRGYDGVLAPGQTTRIFTGAALPTGADRVVIQEQARRSGETVAFDTPSPGANVRRQGCDFQQGEALLQPGQRLNAWRIALAAAIGRSSLACGRRPTIDLLATGDELVEPGQSAGPHQIYNSGVPALSAFVGRHGGIPARLISAGDRLEVLADRFAAARGDLLVTIGGASVGDHDLVKPAVLQAGGELRVEGVAMRPGKPVWFALRRDGRPVLGLPGNPASALVCAELFLGPLLAALQGGAAPDRFDRRRLAADLAANGPRDHYIRARLEVGKDGERRVRPFAEQDSSLVSVMAAADALIRRPPHAPAAGAGDWVEVWGPDL